MKKTILVIDDDLELAGITETWLLKAGYKPLIAEDGMVGLRRVYSS